MHNPGKHMHFKKFEVLDITDNSKVKGTSLIAVEDTITLFANDIRVASIMATPDMLRELAVGYLICGGAVDDPKDIVDVRLGKNLEVRVTLKTSCEKNEDTHVTSDARFTADSIRGSLTHLDSEAHEKTRGTHSASLIDQDGSLVVKAIDIGRHNAVDKVVGSAVLDGIDLSRVFLISTGRQSAGMVLKAARAGIPLVVSRKAPLSSGIETAKKAGVTLVCFASEDKLSVYSHPERIES